MNKTNDIRETLLGLVCVSVLLGCGGQHGASGPDGGQVSPNPLADASLDANDANTDASRVPGTDASVYVNPDAGGSALIDSGEPTCGASPFEAERVAANLLLVIDKSGSMSKTPDGFSTDKWTALTRALDSSLSAVQDDLSVGVDLYPVGAGACELPSAGAISVGIDQGADHVKQIISKLEATTPSGSTPTAAALARALAYYTKGEGAGLSGRKYVLLATDGGPNCNNTLSCGIDACTANLENPGVCNGDNCCTPTWDGDNNGFCLDDQNTLSAVQALAKAGIPTVVVGIPGSEAFAPLLDKLAVAGGVPSGGTRDYFAVTADGSGAGGLVDLLNSVTQQLIRTCDLQLASTPPDLGKLNVEVDGNVIARDADDGWQLDTTTTPPTVRLQGATCDSVKMNGAMQVQVTFGCPTVVLL